MGREPVAPERAVEPREAADAWPQPGGELVTGGSPRYQIYPTSDGRFVAAAPLEQKFWETFCGLIGLAPEWRDDARDSAGTQRAVAALIARESADYWRGRFAGQDCCCTIVQTIGGIAARISGSRTTSSVAFFHESLSSSCRFTHVVRIETIPSTVARMMSTHTTMRRPLLSGATGSLVAATESLGGTTGSLEEGTGGAVIR